MAGRLDVVLARVCCSVSMKRQQVEEMILDPGFVHHHALRVRIEYKNNLVIAQGIIFSK